MIVLDTLLTDGIKHIAKSICKKTKEDTELKKFIKSYIKSNCEKYTYVKTFLHGGKNLKFDEFYFPLSIQSKYSSQEIIPITTKT